MEDWRRLAACLGTDLDLWFALDGAWASSAPERIRVRKATVICKGCPVRADCLRFAINSPEYFGIWGGTTEKERANLRRRRSHERLEALISEAMVS